MFKACVDCVAGCVSGLTIFLRNESVIVCQLDVFYPVNDQSEDKIDILPIPVDSDNNLASDYFEDLNFSVRFKAYEGTLSIFIGESHLETVSLYHSLQDIKFISVNGHVKDEQQHTEERYGTQLNGGLTTPPWQTPDQTMYRMPTELKSGNEMTIKGVIPNDGRLNIQLRDDSVIIFQMLVSIASGIQNEDKIEFTPRTDAINVASDYFVEANYTVRLKSYGEQLSVFVGESHLETIDLNHATMDIKYLMINGQVKELSFVFN